VEIQNCFIKKTNLKKTFFSILAIDVSLLTVEACKHKRSDLVDSELLKKLKITIGFVRFKNSDSFLDKSSVTGNNYKYLKTRCNDIAARKHDLNGKIILSSKFD